MGQFVGCVKYLLFIFNFLLWLLGCALLSVGIWMKLDDSADHYVEQVTEKVDEKYQINYNVVEAGDNTATFAYLLICFGIVVIIITFIGCCGAVRENVCFLAVFAVCLFVITVSLVGIGIWANHKKNNVTVHTLELQDKTDINVLNAVQQYSRDEASRDFMDKLQEKFGCCGGKNAEQDYPLDGIPATCLPEHYRRRCTDFYFRYVGNEIQEFLEHRYSVLAGICLGVGICLALGGAVTLLLCCLIRRASSARVS